MTLFSPACPLSRKCLYAEGAIALRSGRLLPGAAALHLLGHALVGQRPSFQEKEVEDSV